MKVKVWCESCKGSGRVLCEGWNGKGWNKVVICKECEGKGYIDKDLYELDTNQDLPNNPHVDQDAKDSCWPDSPYEEVYSHSQQDMINAGWRKVKNAKE